MITRMRRPSVSARSGQTDCATPGNVVYSSKMALISGWFSRDRFNREQTSSRRTLMAVGVGGRSISFFPVPNVKTARLADAGSCGKGGDDHSGGP